MTKGPASTICGHKFNWANGSLHRPAYGGQNISLDEFVSTSRVAAHATRAARAVGKIMQVTQGGSFVGGCS